MLFLKMWDQMKIKIKNKFMYFLMQYFFEMHKIFVVV